MICGYQCVEFVPVLCAAALAYADVDRMQEVICVMFVKIVCIYERKGTVVLISRQ